MRIALDVCYDVNAGCGTARVPSTRVTREHVMASSTGERMIDADGHVCERLDLPPDVLSAFFSQLLGDAEVSTTDPAPEEASHAEVMNRPGAYEPGPRLVDMDADGIDVAVLYPTAPGLQWVPDPGADAHDGAGVQPLVARVLRGRPRAPLRRRPRRAPGSRARRQRDGAVRAGSRVQGRDDPSRALHRQQEAERPVYDPFWDAAAQLGCPIGVHPSRSPTCRGTSSPGSRSTTMRADIRTRVWRLRQALGNALDVMVAMGWFVAGGICERFPQLTVAFLEGSGGWCAPMLERFDHHVDVFGSRYQTDAAVRDLQAPVLHQLRPRRGGARLYREQQVRRCRPDRVGVRLPAPRCQDPGCRSGARRSNRDA